ncbi:MAG TPA: MFS transporter [Pirellulales bacterium]
MIQTLAEPCACEAPPVEPFRLRRPPKSARRDLRTIMGDGVACSVMIGIGENYLAPFALALGMGELVAGLVASVPILAGAVLQMITPWAIRRLGSNRRWVVACVVCQVASFLPLAAAALGGHLPVVILFSIAAIYWASGMASGPAWTTWVDTLIPPRIRSAYFGRRARLCQAATLIGFAGGGLWLEFGESRGTTLGAFAVLFLVAAGCRSISAILLSRQSERRCHHASPVVGAAESILEPLSRDHERRLLLYLWVMQAAAQVASPYFTPFMLGGLKFSYLKFMLVVSTSLVAKAVALPTLGLLAQRFGAMRLLWIAGFIVIPLPLFWMISQATPLLLLIQVMAGAAWATYELAAFLLFFEAVDARNRTGFLTIYNLGYAAATVAVSLAGGGLLAVFGETHAAYLTLFAASGVARLLTVPFLIRTGRVAHTAKPEPMPATILFPTVTPGEEPSLRRAA